MIYSTVTSLRWADAEEKLLDCVVEFEGLGAVPFTASADDPTPHTQDIFARALNGDFGPIAAYEPPTQTLDQVKAAKKAAAEAEYETRLAAGYPVPDTDETLQLRTELDRTNWLALKDACNDAIMAGAGSEPCALPIRTTSNASLAMTWAEAADLMRGLRAWGAAMMAQLWALKDAIEAAEDQTALDAIDVASGWPS